MSTDGFAPYQGTGCERQTGRPSAPTLAIAACRTLALEVARNAHPPQLGAFREPLEAAHRDEPLAGETKKELTAAAQINLFDGREISFVLLLTSCPS